MGTEREMYFLGIDGGGTRSTAAVADDRGNIVARASGESINYYSVGMDEARKHLAAILAELKNRYGISRFDCAYIGMSALNQEADNELMQRFAAGVVPSRRIMMHSDAYIALNALTFGKPGMLVISGTGSTAVARDGDGRYLHVGGWGYMLGDQGSAYDIALKGIRSAFRSFEGMEEPTMLEESVKSHFAVTRLPEMVDVVYNPVIPRHVLAEFAVRVSECAKLGDRTARRILEEAAKDLALHVDALVRKTGMREATVGVYGGVLMNDPHVLDSFKAEVLKKYPECTVKIPELAPEIGAIMCGFEQCGIAITDEIIGNLSQSRPTDARGSGSW